MVHIKIMLKKILDCIAYISFPKWKYFIFLVLSTWLIIMNETCECLLFACLYYHNPSFCDGETCTSFRAPDNFLV